MSAHRGAGSPGRPRERVVLAERVGARMVRARVEVQQQTAFGDAMVRALIRAQLLLAVRLAAGTMLALSSIPLLILAFPALADVRVLGIRLPWLVLGAGVYPVLYAVGRRYIRQAERLEAEFAELADD